MTEYSNLTPLWSLQDPALSFPFEKGAFPEDVDLYQKENFDVSTIEHYRTNGDPEVYWVRDLVVDEIAEVQNLIASKGMGSAVVKCFEYGVQRVTNMEVTNPETGVKERVTEWMPRNTVNLYGKTRRKMTRQELQDQFGSKFKHIQSIGMMVHNRSFR